MTAPVMVGPSPRGGGPAPFQGLDHAELLADVGDRIRAERKARRWTPTELGRRAGISLSAVRNLEEGGSSHLSSFVRVCVTLGILDTVLSGEWRLPEDRPYLSPQQARVLESVADGRPLSEAARALHMTAGGVASVLTSVYRRLGVADVTRGKRRAAAVRVAQQNGLIDAP